MACIMASCVPTASTTECAPRPSVMSLILAAPSSPRSVTISVAPNSSASRWRDSWRLIAIIRSAPSCLAASTASRPTAPSPTTATVLPGPASAATAPNQPVPSTSEAASRLGIRSSGGIPGVATGLPLDAGRLVAGPADLAGVVGGEERADDELAGLDQTYLAADLLDDADVLVAHRCRPVDRLEVAVGPEVRAAHAGDRQSDDGVGWLDDRRVGALLEAHVPGAIKNCSSHNLSPSEYRVLGLVFDERRRAA